MSLHVLALLKGTVEGDPYTHLAALTAVRQVHLPAGVRAGMLVVDGDGEIRATAAGEVFYRWYGLDRFPPGRANMWPALVPELVDAALAGLSATADGGAR